MKNLFASLFAAIFILLTLSNFSYSQLKQKDNLLGGAIGFWAKEDAPMFGINFESQLDQAGIGTIGLGGIFRYYAYSYYYSNGDSRRYSFTSFGLQCNYNFNQIGDGKFVPFAGLVLGYNYVHNTYTDYTKNGVYESDVHYTSGAWLWLQGGLRYFFSRSVAGSVRLGLGNHDFNTLELGVDFKL